MSAIYNLEPQPTASCILHTTGGDISLELWAQQLPLACRNFLQHCLDGYYDNTIFHRLVPNFILQGGDPTGTGNGGESIYDGGAFSESREEGGIWPMEDRHGKNAGMRGVGFKDEFHSRIKFNRRGLLGMANEGPDSNGSQFFITLDTTPELQGKNTLFGRVEGNTIYNVARMGEAEVGESERPLYPIKITGVEVLVNPFKDMVRRERIAPVVVQQKNVDKKKKRKVEKQLLSFEDDEGVAEDTQPLVKKAKFDTRVVMDVEDMPELRPKVEKQTKMIAKETTKTGAKAESPARSPSPPSPKFLQENSLKVASYSLDSSPEPMQKVKTPLERTNAQIIELKASMRRTIQPAAIPSKKKSAFESMIPATSTRGRKRHPGETLAPDQKAVDLLEAFKSKLDNAAPVPPPRAKESRSSEAISEKAIEKNAREREEGSDFGSGGGDGVVVAEEESILCDLHFIASCQSCSVWDNTDHNSNATFNDDEDDFNDTSWLSHTLSFREDKLGKDLRYRKKAEEELVVIDPREKARSLKENLRSKTKRDSGARDWDRRAADRSRQGKLA